MVAWLTTPGISVLRAGSFAFCRTRHSCSCDVAGLEGIGLRLHLKDQIDDVLKRQVVGVRSVPAVPQHRW